MRVAASCFMAKRAVPPVKAAAGERNVKRSRTRVWCDSFPASATRWARVPHDKRDNGWEPGYTDDGGDDDALELD